ARSLPLTWIAAAMTAGDHLAFPESPEGGVIAREVRLGRQLIQVRYVSLPAEVYALHYDEISNQLLWFLQHYLWDPATWPSFTEAEYHAWEHGYRTVNAAIARAIIDEAQAYRPAGADRGAGYGTDGAHTVVLLQDYHLYLAAGFVRERLPRATV